MTDTPNTFAAGFVAGRDAAAEVASSYDNWDYVRGLHDNPEPGSPYDRGKEKAAKEIATAISALTPPAEQGGDSNLDPASARLARFFRVERPDLGFEGDVEGLSPVDAPANVVDLEREAYHSLSDAAGQSCWIPDEYLANDWLADCTRFLRTGEGVVAKPQGDSAELIERLTCRPLFGEPADSQRLRLVAAEAAQALTAQAAENAALRAFVRRVHDHLANDTFYGDVPDEIWGASRALLEAEPGK